MIWVSGNNYPADQVKKDSYAISEAQRDPKQPDDNRVNFKVFCNSSADSAKNLFFSGTV